ncbi:Plasmodium exported protein (PHISTc), unknown function [Plasmodium ovale]|uniref:Plasmodium RESA N-terminal domain-containing protein n=2 Tax=Plasmodium ovale TaxID=36330 RepID=A0A1A8X9E1_PLAOA|nr:hypothetical protein (PHIST) [Plasmodium ovale curtisi]SBT85059.1 Plasmodium exported protein (PHISTc), unknown function [Plasmodium ovale]
MFSVSCTKIINSSVKLLGDENMNTVKYSIVSFEDEKKKRKKRIPKKCTLCTMLHIICFALLYILILNIHMCSEKGDLHLHLSCRSERNLGEFIPMLRKCFTGNHEMDKEKQLKTKLKTDEKEQPSSERGEKEKEKVNSKMDEKEKVNSKRDDKSGKQNYVEEICNTLNRCGPYISVEQMEDMYHKLHDYQRRKFLTMIDELWHFTVSYAGKHQISEGYRSKYWWECSNILTCNLMKMHKSDLDNFALFLKKQSNSTEEYKRFVMEKIKLWDDFTSEKKKMWTALLKAQLKKY